MAKIVTKMIDSTDAANGVSFSRFEVYVNHKKQIGHILGVPNSNKESKDRFASWRVENDPFNKDYPNSDKAVEALCAKNGRKLKLKVKEKNDA